MGAKERLIERIQRLGISETELARRVGENPQWVRRRTKGTTPIAVDELPRFARALDTPCSWFYEGSECPEAGTSVPEYQQPLSSTNRGLTDTGAVTEAFIEAFRHMWDEMPPENRQRIHEAVIRLVLMGGSP